MACRRLVVSHTILSKPLFLAPAHPSSRFFSTVLPPLALSTVITTLPQKTVHRSGHNTRSSESSFLRPSPLLAPLLALPLLLQPLSQLPSLRRPRPLIPFFLHPPYLIFGSMLTPLSLPPASHPAGPAHLRALPLRPPHSPPHLRGTVQYGRLPRAKWEPPRSSSRRRSPRRVDTCGQATCLGGVKTFRD